MSERYEFHKECTWSEIEDKDLTGVIKKVSADNPVNLGVHMYGEKICTSGFAGISRVIGDDDEYISTDEGIEDILVVSPKYEPESIWVMLETVLFDDEYDDYCEEMQSAGKVLFTCFFDQEPIQMEEDIARKSEILCAISFVASLYRLCLTGVKTDWCTYKENYTGKIKGKLDVISNIKQNTFKGRNDRFVCSSTVKITNILENQILKAALLKCKEILNGIFKDDSILMTKIMYCLSCLRDVSVHQISKTDYAKINVGGMFSYYKAPLQMSRILLSERFSYYLPNDGDSYAKSTFVIPYAINMESLFEFYVRAKLRKLLEDYRGGRYLLEDYSKRINIFKKVNPTNSTHMMSYCIPDILIYDTENNNQYVAVFDAKYKDNEGRSNRSDSQQLLSYVLLTGVEKCGFIMPCDNAKDDGISSLKKFGESEYLEVVGPKYQQIKYFEVIFEKDISSSILEKMDL